MKHIILDMVISSCLLQISLHSGIFNIQCTHIVKYNTVRIFTIPTVQVNLPVLKSMYLSWISVNLVSKSKLECVLSKPKENLIIEQKHFLLFGGHPVELRTINPIYTGGEGGKMASPEGFC